MGCRSYCAIFKKRITFIVVFRFRCVYTVQVAWIHFERSAILTVHTHVVTRNPRIGMSHENHRTWYLHLSDIQENDRGRYLCQINTAQVKTQSAYLNIVGKIG